MLNIRPIKKDTEINDSKTHGVPREQRMTKCGVLLYEGATSSSLARCRWSCRGGWRAALGPPLCGSFRSPPPPCWSLPKHWLTAYRALWPSFFKPPPPDHPDPAQLLEHCSVLGKRNQIGFWGDHNNCFGRTKKPQLHGWKPCCCFYRMTK